MFVCLFVCLFGLLLVGGKKVSEGKRKKGGVVNSC